MSQVHHAPCVSMPSSCHFSCSRPPSSGNRSGDLHLAGENERRERPKRSDPSCTFCNGTGPVDCRNCFGRGRINHVDLVVLPKGEWPQWCQICGGSGLDYCHRCHGTGEYRKPKASTSLSIENELCLGGAARPVKIQQI